MSNTPEIKTYEAFLSEMATVYTSKIGVNDLNAGSAVLSFFETIAQSLYRCSGDILSILREFSVDRGRGEALQKLAREENLMPLSASVATGMITIEDSNFNKIVTKIYAGGSSPNIGSTVILVSDASEFTPTGRLYIGRGTPNIEGPLNYHSIVSVGSYYEINLTDPTTKFHNLSESVILAQGGTRVIPSGTMCQTSSSGGAAPVTFITTLSSTILDGEDHTTNVPVAAQEPGADGNVPRNAIREFVGAPFSGAVVFNSSAFSTGRNKESDAGLRNRIKRARLSRGLGTATSVKNSILGAQAKDENAIISASQIFADGQNTFLYIDNGEGYEEKTRGVGLEFIVDSALGGETHFQLALGGSQTSIAKAFVESSLTAPFNVQPNQRLSVLVGGQLSEHVFFDHDFRSNGFATANEIASSINANPNLIFFARTIDNFTKVSISAKNEFNEDIQVVEPTVGVDANIALGFPTNEAQTLRLYRNNRPLSRNGRSALILSAPQNEWAGTISTGNNLIISVDNTSYQTYIFTDADFIAEGTHRTVSRANSVKSWVNVINKKVIGVTASISGTQLVITSNLGASNRAALSIDPASDLVDQGMFRDTEALGLQSSGAEADYVLSRNTGQGRLARGLTRGESLSGGSELTNATIDSLQILGGIVTLAEDAYLWFVLDSYQPQIITHGIMGETIFHFTKEANNTVRLRSDLENVFVNVHVGDYIILWSNQVNEVNRIEGRVCDVGTDIESNDYFEVRLTEEEYNNTIDQSLLVYREGLTFLRSNVPPQKIKIEAGPHNINTIASMITERLQGVTVSVERDEILKITTNSSQPNSNILLATFNDPAKMFNFRLGDYAESMNSHFAFRTTRSDQGEFPLFFHSHILLDNYADTPNEYINYFYSVLDLNDYNINHNMLVKFLDPYLFDGQNIKDGQATNEVVQLSSLVGGRNNIIESPFVRYLRANDRFFVASPLVFTHNDSIITILENDPTNKTFPIRFYRRAITNSTMENNSTQFRAYDVESGETTEFKEYFGKTFDFTNYKALMRARAVIDPNTSEDKDAILFRSVNWGSAGNNYRLSYGYPTSSTRPISHIVEVGEYTDIKIFLKSSIPVTNTIDGTTKWNIIVDENVEPGIDEVIYRWDGIEIQRVTGANETSEVEVTKSGNLITFTSSDFNLIANGVLVGDKVVIGDVFKPANRGTFNIVSRTVNSFTINNVSGVEERPIKASFNGLIHIAGGGTATLTVEADVFGESENKTIAGNGIDDCATLIGSGYTITEGGDAILASGITSSIMGGNNSVILGLDYENEINISSEPGNYGTNPAMNTLTIGDYVNISYGGEFDPANLGVFRVYNCSSKFFTVRRPHGIAINQSVVATLQTNVINLYKKGNTTAEEIVEYVNENLKDYLTAELIDDNGDEGEGLIYLSTYEDNGFLPDSENIRLVDGINWILSSELDNDDSDPQFIFKYPLELTSADTNTVNAYQFRNGEEVRLVPTTYKQLSEFLNILAVTGLSTLGKISLVQRDNRLQLSTQVLGSDGAIQISGGTANTTQSAVMGASSVVNDNFMRTNISRASAIGFSSDQWVKINSKNLQKKEIGISVATDVTIIPNKPANNETIFILGQKYDHDLYFGLPRNKVRDEGRAFHVEKHGSLVCISWDNVGSDPIFSTILDINDDDGIVGVNYDEETGYTSYTIESGTRNFAEASQGDIITLNGFGDLSNNGTYKVVGVSSNNKTIVVDNPNGVDRSAIPIDSGNIVITTSVQEGDNVQIGVPFHNLNRGIFRVIRIFNDSIYINNPSAIEERVVINNNSIDLGIDSSTEFEVTIDEGYMRLVSVNGTAPNFNNVRLGDIITINAPFHSSNRGSFMISNIQLSPDPLIECINVRVHEESIVIGSVDAITCHRPSMIFSSYNTTVPSDTLVISGSVLGNENVGNYTIKRVINKNEIVLDTVLQSLPTTPTPLMTFFNQIYIQEQKPYEGFKKIHNIAIDPSNTNRTTLIFDSINQFNKINQPSETQIVAMSKLNFPQSEVRGLDAYKYHTGLIAEASKIVYGEPRNPIAYPGVSAAGAEIFILPPLSRRIEISINIRVRTGVPFIKITEQVRNNIAALINSSPLGESIAISSIISSVNTIPGVKAVSITSPSYSPQHDVIVVNPAEKPFIADVVNDIIVSRVE